MTELRPVGDPTVRIAETTVPAQDLLPRLVIPPFERLPVGDPRRDTFKLAKEMDKKAEYKDGEKAYRELQEKGYFVGIDSTVEDLLKRVTDERPYDTWIKDERTGQYLKHAIETARKYAGDHALWQLSNLGIDVTDKSTVPDLLKQLEPHKWIENDLTKQFLQCGINVINAQKEQEQITEKGETVFSILEWMDAIDAALEEEFSLPEAKATSDEERNIVFDTQINERQITESERTREEEQLQKEAYDTLTNLGYWVRADSDRAQIMAYVTNLGERSWQEDDPTKAYIEKALDYAEVHTPQTEQFDEGNPAGIRYLTTDPHTDMSGAIFLPKSTRDLWGVKPGEAIPVRIGGIIQEVRVERPRVRDDGTIEGTNASQIRMSEDILSAFEVPKLTATKMSFDTDTLTVHFEPKPENGDTKKIIFREARGISAEKEGQGVDKVYLSGQDQKRLQIKAGEVITIRMGNYLKQVIVEAGQNTTDSDDIHSPWRLSQNLVDDMGMPEELPIRAAYNKEKKELAFGPGIAVIETDMQKAITEEQTVKHPEVETMMQKASEYGAFVISVDPRRQTKEDMEKGFVTGLVWTGTEYKNVRIPRPDVIYNKTIRDIRSGKAGELMRSFPKKIMDGWAAEVGNDKLWFDYGLQEYGLEKYRAEAKSLHNIAPEEFEAFLEKYNKVIIKPQKGAVGTGVFEVERLDDGSYMVRENIRGSRTASEGRKETAAKTAEEALWLISQVPEVAKRPDNMKGFMMQEKIDMYEYGYDDPGDGEWISGHPEPRVLVQRGVDGKPIIGGIVARMQNDKIGTPHNLHIMDVLHGIYPQEEEKVWEKIKEIEQVAVRVLEMAEQEALKRPGVKPPQNLGEFVVDFGIRADGELALIEASTGAMTNVYQDNYGEKVKNMQDALSNRATGPIAYALHLSGIAA